MTIYLIERCEMYDAYGYESSTIPECAYSLLEDAEKHIAGIFAILDKECEDPACYHGIPHMGIQESMPFVTCESITWQVRPLEMYSYFTNGNMKEMGY